MSHENLINERARARGFDSIEALLAARPGVGVVALADELGLPIVGVDIVRAFLTQAHARGAEAFRAAAIDLLARHMREILVNGWGRLRPSDSADTDVEIVNITPWSLWSSQVSAVDDTLDDRAQAVFEALRSRATDGWIPRDRNDPTLRSAFDAAWPIM